MTLLAVGLIGLGVLLNAVSVLGALRFPDVYTRAHALGIADTLGALAILSGFIAWHGLTLLSLKFALLALVLLIINPTVIHTVLQAALEANVRPWTRRERAR
ncbi:MAG TPA: monovalent cation/H(+) antiporter subunit G [bacterium]